MGHTSIGDGVSAEVKTAVNAVSSDKSETEVGKNE